MSRTRDTSGLGLAFRRVSSVVLFGVLPAALVLLLMSWTVGTANFLSDFHGDLYNAGSAIIAGHDPYRPMFLARLAAMARAGGHPSNVFAVPVYPAPALLAAVPLALVGYQAAGVIFTLLGIAAFGVALWLLGVRDWRCYGAAFLSWPLLHSLRLGQLDDFLVLGAAVLWRWRGRALPAAAGLAAVVVAKLVLWPLGLFLLITHRWRAAALAVILGAAITLIAWAVIGFDGFTNYPQMISDLSRIEGAAGISLGSLAAALHLPRVGGDIARVIVTAALLWLAWSGLRGPHGERRAFSLAIVAGLTSSSLVWPHYEVLLFVPIALLSPTLGPLWLVPLACWAAPVELTHGSIFSIVIYMAVEIVVVGVVLRGPGGATRPLKSPLTRGSRSPAMEFAGDR
jgi:hypothetical protein